MEELDCSSTWRIYNPKKFPLHTYFTAGDIVNVEHNSTVKSKLITARYRLLTKVNNTANHENLSSANELSDDAIAGSRFVNCVEETKLKRRRLDGCRCSSLLWNVEKFDSCQQIPKTDSKTNTNTIIPTPNEITIANTSNMKLVFGADKQQKGIEIVVTETTDHFRQIASRICNIESNDRIIEIGCSTGQTSRLLWQRLSTCPLVNHVCDNTSTTKNRNAWIGFDTSKTMVDNMKKVIEKTTVDDQSLNPNSNLCRLCVCMNVLSNPAAAFDSITTFFSSVSSSSTTKNTTPESCDARSNSPTVVFIDIGGNREEYAVLRMISWILTERRWMHSIRLVVTKSKKLFSSLTSGNNYNDTNDVPCVCDQQTGVIQNGDTWFQNRLQKLHNYSIPNKNQLDDTEGSRTCYDLPKHPLQAPMRYRPSTERQIHNKSNHDTNASSTIEKVLICRYHNYHIKGCKRFQDANIGCPYDHEYCHWCLEKGHVARCCPEARTDRSKVM